jgi:hypothetical protein
MEGSVSLPPPSPPRGERAPSTHWIWRWLGHRTGLDVSEERRTSCLSGVKRWTSACTAFKVTTLSCWPVQAAIIRTAPYEWVPRCAQRCGNHSIPLIYTSQGNRIPDVPKECCPRFSTAYRYFEGTTFLRNVGVCSRSDEALHIRTYIPEHIYQNIHTRAYIPERTYQNIHTRTYIPEQCSLLLILFLLPEVPCMSSVYIHTAD